MKDNRLPEILHNSEMNSYFETIFNSNCTSKAFEDSTGLKWNLPVIIVCEKEPIYKRENILDGVLGIYFHEKKWKSEGRIVLYPKNIQKASDEIVSALKDDEITIDPEFAYDSLTKIVLLHELGHWIHHWKLPTKPVDKTEENCHYNFNFKDQSTELKEGIAQYYVWLTIEKEPALIEVFEKLLIDQGPVYHGHKELIKQGANGKLIIENYIPNYDLLKDVLTAEDILKPSQLELIKQDSLTEIVKNNFDSFFFINPFDMGFLKPFISEIKLEELILELLGENKINWDTINVKYLSETAKKKYVGEISMGILGF
jgi:hypothetical protein